jgi:transposase
MVLSVVGRVKVQVRKLRRSTRDAGIAQRCQIVLHAGKGRGPKVIADALGCSYSWAVRVVGRFRREGVLSLVDRREDNGKLKLDADYLDQLYEVVQGQPSDYGYARPTWTRELLVAVLEKLTGVRIHVGTMSRALKQIGARRGRARPTVRCPWPKAKKQRKLRALRTLAAQSQRGEEVVYADEVDVHLNPKIGLDWMNRGQQKEVTTPGQNQKRYLAGALDAASGRLICVEGARKNSTLFVGLLKALLEEYPQARRIHVILDNYRIHHSRLVELALANFASRITLHFLPPYCPNDNRIERVWQDLHAEVTRNHRCSSMSELIDEVWSYLRYRNNDTKMKIRRLAA